MRRHATRLLFALALVAAAPPAQTQPSPNPQEPTAQPGAFDRAAAAAHRQLEQSIAELARVREQIAAEKLPLHGELNRLEEELIEVRQQYQEKVKLLESRSLELANLRTTIKAGEDEAAYLDSLLADFVRSFESRLHIAETSRYEAPLQAAKQAAENLAMTAEQVHRARLAVLSLSLDRLLEVIGGSRFQGSAVGRQGAVRQGTFAMVGPVVVFRSDDGQATGSIEQRLNSHEPSLVPFDDPALVQAAAEVVASGTGSLPLDPTLGNASRIGETRETLWEHVQRGGPVMVPILAMAAAALLVALCKWVSLLLQRRPSRRRLVALQQAVAEGDRAEAERLAGAMRGPVGRMLAVGVAHLGEPKELVEEVMYESVLTDKLRLQRMLPFIAICAASAPLLGLLGTVTGIIDTFKMITVFGSGDVKALSGGISEALITTEFGLIVAIPSLLLHAYLSRKVRGIVGQMETAGVAFVNQVIKAGAGSLSPSGGHALALPDPELVRSQVSEILREMLGPLADEEPTPETEARRPEEPQRKRPQLERRVVSGFGGNLGGSR